MPKRPDPVSGIRILTDFSESTSLPSAHREIASKLLKSYFVIFSNTVGKTPGSVSDLVDPQFV
jgi:hypothetical protein